MSLRIEKVNSLIQRYIADIINRELNLKPGIFVSVSKVDTTKDMRYTRIFVSVFPFSEKHYAESTLKKEIYRIQGSLNKKMQSKIVPRVEFIFEDTQEKVSQMEELFETIRKEDESTQ